MFCVPVLEFSNDFQILTYYFFTSGAAVLSIFTYLPEIHRTTTQSLKDLKSPLQFSGFPQISPLDMPKPMLDRTDDVYLKLLRFSSSVPTSQGVIINSFESLEPRAVKTISDGLCFPDGLNPPIYYIGPLVADGDRTVGSGSSESSEWLKWLDTQPSRSVVLLCFGSLGLFGSSQLSEIAVGLEKSGQRFLWVVRSPPADDKLQSFLAPTEPNLDTLVPEGFLARTNGRGFVVKLWIPQVAVLNKVLLVEEIELALPMNKAGDGFVTSTEVERRVNELMCSEEGKALRERVMRMRREAKAAMRPKAGHPEKP